MTVRVGDKWYGEYKCEYCKKEVLREPCKAKRYRYVYCNTSCQNKHRFRVLKEKPSVEEAHQTIRDKPKTRYVSKKGYWTTTWKGRKRYEHHKIWCEEHKVDNIPKGYVIHHINCNKLDNRVENLKLMERIKHLKLHAKLNKNGKIKPTV